MLEIGSNPPSIMAQCHQCDNTFCKYAIFGDPQQTFEMHYNGLHGNTPLVWSCSIESRDIYNLESLVCEIGNCIGNHVIFCSTDCKEEHSPECDGCKERTHFSVIVDGQTYCKECAKCH